MSSRARSEPNSFEEALIRHQAFTEHQPVSRVNLEAITNHLEDTGNQLVGAGQVTSHRFAEVMHGVFVQMTDLDIVPPLTEAKKRDIAGKVAIYAAMLETTQPKQGRRRSQTDTGSIPTDERKQ